MSDSQPRPFVLILTTWNERTDNWKTQVFAPEFLLIGVTISKSQLCDLDRISQRHRFVRDATFMKTVHLRGLCIYSFVAYLRARGPSRLLTQLTKCICRSILAWQHRPGVQGKFKSKGIRAEDLPMIWAEATMQSPKQILGWLDKSIQYELSAQTTICNGLGSAGFGLHFSAEEAVRIRFGWYEHVPPKAKE